MKIYNFPQGSDDWFNIRLGKITGSKIDKLLEGKRGYGKTTEKEILTLTAERLTNKNTDSNFSTIHTERGNACEDDARSQYEKEYNVKVETIGFAEIDNYVGYSPDGLVGDDGMIEIKCPDTHIFVKRIYENTIPTEYISQIQLGLYVLKRNWCDFICYNSNFDKLFVKRMEKDEVIISKIQRAIERTKGEIDKYIEAYFNN